MRISKNIAYLIHKNNISSVIELSKELNCPSSTLYNIIRNELISPRVDILITISKFFNVNLDDLVFSDMSLETQKTDTIITKKEVYKIILFSDLNLFGYEKSKKMSTSEINISSNNKINHIIEVDSDFFDDIIFGTKIVFSEINIEKCKFPTHALIKNESKYLIEKVFIKDGFLCLKKKSFFKKSETYTLIEEKYDEYTIIGFSSQIIIQ